MKRVWAILILVMSGSLLIAVSQSPGDAFAADPTEQYLETDDWRDDLVDSLFGKADGLPDGEGDPDSLIDGLENVKRSDGVEDNNSLSSIEGLTLEDLWIFIAVTIQILP